MKWRLKIHDQELIDSGFIVATDDQKFRILAGLMHAKGVPADEVLGPGDMDIEPVDNGIMVGIG